MSTTLLTRLLTTGLLGVTYRVNYLSSSGQLGENLLILRQVFPFPYMPAGWTFAVARSAIYLALGIWGIRSWTTQWKNNPTNNAILPRFWLSCVLNTIWIFFTAREWYALSIVVIAALMVVLWQILKLLARNKAAYIQTIPFWLYAGRVTMATTIVGISQFVYIMLNNQRPLTDRRTVLVIGFGVCVAGRLFWKYHNRAQLVITLVALAGVMSSVLG